MNADYESMPPQPMAMCYHCDQEKAVPGSVFCGTCQPNRTGQPPRIIREKRPAMRRKGLFSAFFGLLASSKRAAKVEASLRDCEQANLALRRKCADLKDQLRASEAAFESLYKENVLAKAAHNRASSERDSARLLANTLQTERDLLARAKAENESEIESLQKFAEEIRDDWDHDAGANGAHHPSCRCCEAVKIIGYKAARFQ